MKYFKNLKSIKAVINLEDKETKYIELIQSTCPNCTMTSCEKCSIRIEYSAYLSKRFNFDGNYLSYALIEEVIQAEVPKEHLSKSEKRKRLEEKEYNYTLNQGIVCAHCQETCSSCPVTANWKRIKEDIYKEKLIRTF